MAPIEFANGVDVCSPMSSRRAAMPSTDPFKAANAAGEIAFFGDAACAKRPSTADIWPRISSNIEDDRASKASNRAETLSAIVEPRSTVSTREPRSRMNFAICVMSSRVRRSASATSLLIEVIEDSKRTSASLPGTFVAAASISTSRFCNCPSVASSLTTVSFEGESARSASTSDKRFCNWPSANSSRAIESLPGHSA